MPIESHTFVIVSYFTFPTILYVFLFRPGIIVMVSISFYLNTLKLIEQ